MIKISIDEAYAIDMLAILHIKSEIPNTDAKNLTNFLNFLDELVRELGLELCNKILSSDEYETLKHANQEVFNYVELLDKEEKDKTIPIEDLTLAIHVHRYNMNRYHAKKALQQKFFNTELTEQKTID